MILHGVRVFVAAALLALGAHCPQLQCAEAAQISVTASIKTAVSATLTGDGMLVRSNAPWLLTIECEDPSCQLPHVHSGQPGSGSPEVVTLHGERYSICLR